MALLTRLPDIVAIEVLASFCDVVDLCILDSAYCNSNQRKELLNLFENDQFIVTHMQQGRIKTSSKFLLWINNRKVSVDQIYLDIISTPSCIPSLLECKLLNVSYLRVGVADVSQTAMLINSCPKLKSLVLIGRRTFKADAELLKLIDNKILGQLTEFMSVMDDLMSEGFLERLAENCKSLHIFSFEPTWDYSTCHVALLQLFQNNPNLRKLHIKRLPFSKELLLNLAEYCPLLTHLVRDNHGQDLKNLEDWVQIIKSFQHLQYLNNVRYADIQYIYNPIDGTKSINIRDFHYAHHMTGFHTLFTEIKGLSSLRFKVSPGIPDSMYELITQNNSNTLTELDLALQATFPDCTTKIANLLSQCKHLTTLALPGYNKVSSEEWILLSRSVSTLCALKFSGSPTLAVEDIVSFMDTNKALNYIEVHFCKRIQEEEIELLQLAAMVRDMEIIFDHDL